MGVKPVGVIEQPVACTGGSPWEAIKGCAGSSRLTEFDCSCPVKPAPRSVRVSLPEGDTYVMQNDLACTAPSSGHTGRPEVFILGGNVELGRLTYGLGAWTLTPQRMRL
jgi:hypothetical protein